jgi:hypothetical protein
MRYVLTLTRWVSHGKEWVALLTGTHPTYHFAREFARVLKRNWSRSGKNGTTTFELTKPGYYQVSSPSTGMYGRQAYAFYRLTAEGEWINVTREEVEKYFGITPVSGSAVS